MPDLGRIPGPVVIPSTAQIRLRWILGNGKIGFNVLYGRYASSFNGSQAQANTMLTALTTGAQWTALAAFIANTCALSAVWITDVNTAQNAPIPSTVSGQFGTSVSSELPDEVALAITMRSAFVGTQNRGRMFIPGWATNSLGAGGVVAAGAVTALQNWSTTIAGVLSAQGYTWGIGHPARQAYTSPETGREFPARVAGLVPITTVQVRDNHWDSQRRRGLR